MTTPTNMVTWEESDTRLSACWRSETAPLPSSIQVVDDDISADRALSLMNAGHSLLWRGDFHNGRQLLNALSRRTQRHGNPAKRRRQSAGKATAKPAPGPAQNVATTRQAFLRHRTQQAQRAMVLGRLLVLVEADHHMNLRRALDLRPVFHEVWGQPDGQASLVSLRDLQGMVGAHEWRKKGVPVPALGASIYPHYGVFSPLRSEYLDLMAQAALPQHKPALALDIGTGTGVVAALLLKKGVQQVVATDFSARAVTCARNNLERLGLAARSTVVQTDLFPDQRADLIVCNPPWLPGPVGALLDHAVYDPESRMLRGFLDGLADHLTPDGEGWLVISDLAERLGLRERDELLGWIAAAGLAIVERLDTHPDHPKSADVEDPFFQARSQEITSLWRLVAAPKP